MADQKRGKWITNMDSLLQEPVEVVFSMFVSDLKGLSGILLISGNGRNNF